jgi:hypothetical protein
VRSAPCGAPSWSSIKVSGMRNSSALFSGSDFEDFAYSVLINSMQDQRRLEALGS